MPLRTIAASETYRNTVYDVEAVLFPALLTFPRSFQAVGASCVDGSCELPVAIVRTTTSSSTFVSAIASSSSTPFVSIRSMVISSDENERSSVDDYFIHPCRSDASKVVPIGSALESDDGSWEGAPMERSCGAILCSDAGGVKRDGSKDVKMQQETYSHTQSALEEREAGKNGERQSESSLCTTNKFVGNKDFSDFRQGRVGQPHEENVNTVTILSSAFPLKSDKTSEPIKHAGMATATMKQQPLQQPRQPQQPQQQEDQQPVQGTCGQRSTDGQSREAYVGAVRQQPTCFTSARWSPVGNGRKNLVERNEDVVSRIRA